MSRPNVDLHADLHALHDHYIESVNLAVAADDLALVASLGAEYGDEAIRMITDAEGPAYARASHPPARAGAPVEAGLRGLVRRLKNRRAA
jgi:RecB family exonuclease